MLFNGVIILFSVVLSLAAMVGGQPEATKVIYLKGTDSDREVTIQPAVMGKTYTNRTTISSEFHYIYRFRVGGGGSSSATTPRLRTETDRRASLDHPMRITVRVGKGTLNWHVPFESGGRNFYHMERTLCLGDEQTWAQQQEIAVIVSTSSRQSVDFKILLFEVVNFTISLNRQDTVANVSVATPSYKFVSLQDSKKNSLLQVKVTSADPVCAIVSVQPHSCPVSDTELTVRAEGSYQTMLGISSFNIDSANYENGLYIVFVVPESDLVCGVESQSNNRTKSFTFEISDDVSRQQIAWEITISTGILVVLSTLTVLATCLYSEYGKDIEKKVGKITSATTDGPSHERNGQQHHNSSGDNYEESEMQSTANSKMIEMSGTADDTPHQAEDERVKRLPKYVNELATLDREKQKLFKSMFQKSDLYIWLVLMMGIFYGIPAIQLVMSYQRMLQQSGNQDLCYYNFLCSVPVASVTDFNHIYSNIWYLGFGCLFVFLTWYRKRQHFKFLDRWHEETAHNHFEYGLPHHFGIFYAMGFAMIFEGILSACYHFCPTHENYQFDTTFMYVIATLCFLKVYQFRHPDVTCNAYKIFFGLGLIMFFEVMGIFYETTLFWILSLIAYFLLCLILTSILYHSGQWSLDFFIFCRIYRSAANLLTTRNCSENYSTKRLVLVMVLNGINIVFVILGAIYQPGISSYLLGIFISNLLVYSIYYMAMKLYHKERITKSAHAYTAMGLLCWIPAFYFYANADYSTEVSPSQSRNLNDECIVKNLFDHHDIWHMLSAAGLFFCFMLIQTIDDGLFYVPRNQIHIF